MSTGWIKVKRADELRPGLTVELRPCGFCARRERQVLLRQVASPLSLHHVGDLEAGSGSGWIVAPGLCLNPRRAFDPGPAIASGRLWRLGDEVLQEDSTVAREKETERR